MTLSAIRALNVYPELRMHHGRERVVAFGRVHGCVTVEVRRAVIENEAALAEELRRQR